MPFLFIGLLALILCVYGLRQAGRASPAQVAAGMRNGGGVLALAGALLALLRGRVSFAAGLAGLSLWLFGGAKKPAFWQDFQNSPWSQAFNGGRKAPGRSDVRTATLVMTLDHASGSVEGEVLAGPFAGRRLADLSRAECEALYRACVAGDRDAALLLETYFDRRFAGWRTAGEGDSYAGGAGQGANSSRSSRRSSSDMTEEEAYQTLGLRPDATREDIARAHRRLMKERHPDHGGTTDDAARVNQAKDILMRRHA